MYGYKNITKTIIIYCSLIMVFLLYLFSMDFSYPPSKVTESGYFKNVSNQENSTSEKMINVLEKDARWFPTARNFHKLSEVHYRENHYTESFYYAKKASLLEDRNPLFQYQLGKTFYKLGNRAKATQKLKKALRLNPDFQLAKKLLEEINPESRSFHDRNLYALNPNSKKRFPSSTK